MAKLKTAPKAFIVAAIIGGVGFGAYHFMPHGVKVPQDTSAQATPVQQTAALQPVQTAPVAPTQAPAPVLQPVQEAAAPTPTGKLPGAGIASGQKTGTNWPMAEDIVKVCSKPDYPLRNVISDGSIDNLNKIYTDPNSQFGIAQIDAMQYQKQIDPKMMSRVVAVFPFFSVEVHLIASTAATNITKIGDLEGKRVVEGPEGSGTWVTVQILKQLTGVHWTTVDGNLSQKDGLAAVQNGSADAEFIVAGQPIQVLSGATGIKLLTIANPKIDSYGAYTKTQLPTGTYPWQSGPVSTYKVDNVLATFAYKNQYQQEIGDLVSCITRNMDNLQANGHPKWKDVDPLDIDRVKWPVHPAAVAAIKREAKHH